MTLISVLCHASPKISVVMLLVCSKLDWHKTLSLDILVFIATRYNHCWGVLDNLATLGTVNVQVVHVWRHVSKITTYGSHICEIDSSPQVSLKEASPDYNQWALEHWTVRNRLRDCHIRPRRPAIRPILLPRHHAARLTWCKRHLRFRRKEFANIRFTEDPFPLRQPYWPIPNLPPRRRTLCRRLRYSTSFGSLMVCGGITERSRTPLVVVAENLTGIRYRDEIVQLFRSSKLRPTTWHSSRTTLDHMLRVLYVTTWHSRMLMCYHGQRFHLIFHPLSTSRVKWNYGYVIYKISQWR